MDLLKVLSNQVYAVLCQKGVVNQQGDARRLLDDYRKLRSTQIQWTQQLGMSRVSRLAIQADSTSAAIDLAQAASNVGRRARIRCTSFLTITVAPEELCTLVGDRDSRRGYRRGLALDSLDLLRLSKFAKERFAKYGDKVG